MFLKQIYMSSILTNRYLATESFQLQKRKYVLDHYISTTCNTSLFPRSFSIRLGHFLISPPRVYLLFHQVWPSTELVQVKRARPVSTPSWSAARVAQNNQPIKIKSSELSIFSVNTFLCIFSFVVWPALLSHFIFPC